MIDIQKTRESIRDSMLRSIFINCLLALCGLALGCQQSLQVPELKDLNVVLIVVDTLGAKHLQAYNPSLKNAPNISALAKQGILFKHAYAVAPWTKPAIASILTSRLPSKHGLRDLHDRLSENALTMPEMLSQLGFSTVGKVSHTFIAAREGFGQGFDSYELVPFKGNIHNAITSETVSNRAIRWLQERKKSVQPKNFFMFLHYFDPHYNYQHHPQYDRTSDYKGILKPGLDVRELRKLIPQLSKEDIRYLVGLYHEEIQYTDAQIGRVLDHLKQQGLQENTLIILTADHGEEFMEHDFIGHTKTLYEELVNVPLIFSLPKYFKPGVVNENVSTLDILPTLLNLAPQTENLSKQLDGQSLLSFLKGDQSVAPDRKILFEVDFRSSGIKANKAGIKQEDLKLIYDKPGGKWELHNLQKDPDELNDQCSDYPADFERLKPLLQQFLSSQPESAEPRVSEKESPEEVEQLKSLGYL